MAIRDTFTPSGMEKELLDMIGKLGKGELEKLQQGKMFELDPNTRDQLDRILKSQTGAAEGALSYSLDKAAGASAGTSASRGLPRGSFRAELMARMSGPAVQQFQQQIGQINSEDAMRRIELPRRDAAFRQQVLQSPALTALQRTRLSTAELRLRLRDTELREKQYRDSKRSAVGGAFGKLAGTAVGAFLGGPAGAAAGFNMGGALGGGGNNMQTTGGFDTQIGSGDAYGYPGEFQGSYLT